MLLPPPGGGGSPPSSPSNTPVSRRRTSSRKSRLKPRSRKQSKPQLAPADVSTQESTTQGGCACHSTCMHMHDAHVCEEARVKGLQNVVNLTRQGLREALNFHFEAFVSSHTVHRALFGDGGLAYWFGPSS